ncbi:MAG: RodZ domain-containing protein [Leptolyngbya sp.]|nr:RodZ domain-containing protein [Leptolyngbya sp.]
MANLAPTQVEQLQRIGASLRQVRQEQGLSLDILANQIFIRPALLQAIETGREDQLPEPVFVQGFIRRYAEALGLDGKAISHEFTVTPPPIMLSPEGVRPEGAQEAADSPPGAPSAPQARAAVPSPAAATPTQAPAPKVQPPARSGSPLPTSLTPLPPEPDQRSGGGGFIPWLLLIAAILVIGGGIGVFLGRGQTPQTATAPVNETPVPEATPTPAPAPESEPAALEAPIVVAINLTDRAWLSVVADGRTVYEGTPDQGYEETWTAQTSLVFTTGNAGGVSFSFNGEDPVVLGDSGAVRTLRLTPNSNRADLATP